MKKKAKRLGDLGPEKNLRLAYDLADRSLAVASDAARAVQAGQCDLGVRQLSEAAALYGKAGGHFANSRHPDLEVTLQRVWKAVDFSARKVRAQCLRKK